MNLKIVSLILAATLSPVAARVTFSALSRRTQTSCADSGSCPSRSEFCGSDGFCYPYSCENYFKLSGWFATDDTAETSIVCDDYTTGKEDNYHAVIFGCSGKGPGTTLNDGEHSQAFNKRCRAMVEGGAFECYSLDPTTDFSEFLNLAASAPRKECDSTEEQVFIYEIITARGSAFSFKGPDHTEEFDRERAMETMYATVYDTTSEPTPSPTEAPTTPTPTTMAPTSDPTSNASYLLSGFVAMATVSSSMAFLFGRRICH